MFEKSKGSFIYEGIIAVLVIVLLWALIYPVKVWKKQDDMETICRSRMEAIQYLEYKYLEKYYTYTDSFPKLLRNVTADSQIGGVLDSLLNWDMMVSRNKLKSYVAEKIFPEDLRGLILLKLQEKKSLDNLANWDFLGYSLIENFEKIVSKPDSIRDEELIDISVKWADLLTSGEVYSIFNNEDIPQYMKRYSRRSYVRGGKIVENKYWDKLKPYFYEKLDGYLNDVLRDDIWTGGTRKEWEKETRPLWESKYDTLSPAGIDSIKEQKKGILWSERKYVIWNDEVGKLWKSKEREEWIKDNEDVWKRIIKKNWTLQSKKKWLKEKRDSLSDSLWTLFKTKKDSLWKFEVDTVKKEKWVKEQQASLPDSMLQLFETQEDSLWMVEVDAQKERNFEAWQIKNEDFVIKNQRELWESDKSLSWEEGAYQKWLTDMEKKGQLWTDIKDMIWKKEKDILWEKQKDLKRKRKVSSERLLDTVVWIDIVGEEYIVELVSSLELPDNKTIWNIINKDEAKSKSILNDLGIVSLFMDTLLASAATCPVAKEQYLISVVDTVGKKFAIECPITEDASKVLIIDPVTKDTTENKNRISFIQKVLGGKKLRSHGRIGMDAKRSWEEK